VVSCFHGAVPAVPAQAKRRLRRAHGLSFQDGSLTLTGDLSARPETHYVSALKKPGGLPAGAFEPQTSTMVEVDFPEPGSRRCPPHMPASRMSGGSAHRAEMM